MRILVDTNILVRSLEHLHPCHPIAEHAVRLLRSSGHEFVIVPQNLVEFWAVATRPTSNNGLGMTTAEAEIAVLGFLDFFRLLRDERTVFEHWHALVVALDVKGKQVHDARLAAAMQRHSMTHLLTFNGADFARYSFITVLAPAEVAKGIVVI